jgi:hypothetical protein
MSPYALLWYAMQCVEVAFHVRGREWFLRVKVPLHQYSFHICRVDRMLIIILIILMRRSFKVAGSGVELFLVCLRVA